MQIEPVISDGLPIVDAIKASLERIKQPRTAKRSKHASLHAPAVTHYATPILFLSVAAILATGWIVRDELYYTAGEGLGYSLGIAGSACMLLLLLYPMRKNLRFMRTLGPVKHYFRLHMILGVAGPVLILFHANFHLHAINSNVALFSMLLVAASGLIGRFIYTRIHHGLYGERLTLHDLQRRWGISKYDMEHEFSIPARIKQHLEQFEAAELQSSRRYVQGVWRIFTRRVKARWIRFKALHELSHELKMQARRKKWAHDMLRLRLEHDRELIKAYLTAVCRTAEFGTYERIFSLWHVLHIPLFVMMVITGIVHAVAVHMY